MKGPRKEPKGVISGIHRLSLMIFAFLILPSALFFIGCGEDSVYTSKPLLLPAHIRSIAVRPFQNKTQFFGLEDKLMRRVSEEFIRDGRLPLVNDESQADGVVVGEIVRYIREPISYDTNHIPEEYKLWVIINLRFKDRINNNADLWEEPRLEHTYRYFVETKPGGITEEEAREQLWDLFARDIVKRTIEGFGSVSGASERKITDPTKKSTTTIRQDQKPFVVPPSPY